MPDITLENNMAIEHYDSPVTGGLRPDVCRELRRAVVDVIRGNSPSSVIGLLMERREPLTVEAVAGLLGRPIGEIEWTIEMLEEDDLCARISQRGLTKIRAFAAYIDRNQ